MTQGCEVKLQQQNAVKREHDRKISRIRTLRVVLSRESFEVFIMYLSLIPCTMVSSVVLCFCVFEQSSLSFHYVQPAVPMFDPCFSHVFGRFLTPNAFFTC